MEAYLVSFQAWNVVEQGVSAQVRLRHRDEPGMDGQEGIVYGVIGGLHREYLPEWGLRHRDEAGMDRQVGIVYGIYRRLA